MKKLLLLTSIAVAQFLSRHHKVENLDNPHYPKPAAKLAEVQVQGEIVSVRSLKSGRQATYRLAKLNRQGETREQTIARIERTGILFVRAAA